MDSAQNYAKKIVQTLVDNGYIAYFAGGWVRDYLMGHPSSDIDIATDAPPEKILSLFPQTIQVGLIFGVVIVSVDKHLFEVATFRKDVNYSNGRKPEKIELSSAKEDAYRRDFTINGMFYDPISEEIYDYVNGQEDLKRGIVRTIGDPHERFSEDRLRMIRAVRFATRFGFSIDIETRTAIRAYADTLFPAVAMERIWQEITKMAESPQFDVSLMELHRLGLLQVIFPKLSKTPLSEIKKRVHPFALFPKRLPAIVYLIQLFPNACEEELAELCKYLKTSNKDLEFALFIHQTNKWIKKEKEDFNSISIVDWVHFYADTRSEATLYVIAAYFSDEEKRKDFINHHLHECESLKEHIERVKRNKPLVNAMILQGYGIAPGPRMGQLLREAERIAIEENIHDADDIILVLKESELWHY